MDIIPDVRISEQTQLDFIQKKQIPSKNRKSKHIFLIFCSYRQYCVERKEGARRTAPLRESCNVQRKSYPAKNVEEK